MVVTQELNLRTQGHCDMVDITSQVAGVVKTSGLQAGTVTVFCPGSTGGLTTIEYDTGGAGYDVWTDAVAHNVTLPAGVHVLKLAFDQADIAVNYLEIGTPGPRVPGRIEAEDYNLIIWTRNLLAVQSPKLQGYGLLRMVRDVFHIDGRVQIDAQGHIRKIALNQADELAQLFVSGLAHSWAHDETSLSLGQI